MGQSENLPKLTGKCKDGHMVAKMYLNKLLAAVADAPYSGRYVSNV